MEEFSSDNLDSQNGINNFKKPMTPEEAFILEQKEKDEKL